METNAAPTPDASESSNFSPFTGKLPDYYRKGDKGEIIPLTKGAYKKAMHDEWTKRYPSIPACGHAFVPGSEPRHRNCEPCWFAYFQVHGELTQTADEVFAKFGKDGLVQLKGPKFAKNFTKFMATIAQWKSTAEAAKANEETNVDPSGNSETDGNGAGADGHGESTSSLPEVACVHG